MKNLIAAVLLIFGVSAQAALHDRGGGFIYDDVLDVTWLQNANYAGSVTPSDGRLRWDFAVKWVEELDIYDPVRDVTWSDWRLPAALSSDSGCDCYPDCTNHELRHLFYSSGSQLDLFTNLQSGYSGGYYGYWTGVESKDNPNYAISFSFTSGGEQSSRKGLRKYALLVRDGDVRDDASPRTLTKGPDPSIVDIAVQLNAPGGALEGQLDTLIAAVLVADSAVLERLSGFGKSTVFAPTDDAFAALGIDESNVGSLDKTVLTQILLYHVAKGRRGEVAVLRQKRLKMLYGGVLTQNGGMLMDNLGRTSTIVLTNQFAENGVIHAIDTVVLPFTL